MASPPTAPTPARVLLADDDVDVCALVAQVLRPIAGVTVVHDAEAALALLRDDPDAAPFDAIITDYLMPGMTGLEFIANVRRLSIGSPVLMISGHERVEPRLGELAVEAGADAFLCKPFSLGQLRTVIARLLAAPLRPSIA